MKKLLEFIFLSFFTVASYAQEADNFDKMRFPYVDKNTGLSGYINIEGEIVIPCQYEFAGNFSEGLALVSNGNKSGYINIYGELVIPYKYDYDSGGFTEGLAYVWESNEDLKFGYIDKTGREITNYKYDRGHDFKDGIAWVVKNRLWGCINNKGEELVPCVYSDYYDKQHSSEGLRRVQRNKLYGYINYKGEEIVPCRYQEVAMYFSDGMAWVKQNGLFGYIDKTGRIIIPCKYDNVQDFSEGLAFVKKNGEGYYIDKKGNIKIHIKNNLANYCGEFHEGLACVKKQIGNRILCSYIDKVGNLLIPYKYSDAGDFSEGMAWVRYINENNDRIGFINKKGVEIIPCKYEYRGGYDGLKFCNNLVVIPKNDGFVLVDKNGEELFYSSEHFGVAFPDNRQAIYMGDYYIYIDRNGNNVHPTFYKVAEDFSNGFAYVETLEGKLGCINPKGEFVTTQLESKIEEGLGAAYSVHKYYQAQASYFCNGIDVDKDIPQTRIANKKMFAIIIANENYLSESKVDYALKDGQVFKEYCNKTLGVPANNIHYRENATLNQLRAEINWVKQVAKAYNGEANIIFYYAGHCIPDEKTGSGYILPVDGLGNDIESGYALSKLYAELGEVPTKKTLYFLDACFSGSQRNGQMMANARGVAIKSKPDTPQGNAVVFSAAQGDETAYPYKMKQHGLFTYFLLKKLQETKGNVTLSELGDYLTEQVNKYSIVKNKKSQTPLVVPSNEVKGTWKEWNLK